MENYHVVKSTKSVGIGILLTLLFGPIGLFYSSILGGIVMTAAPIILLGIAFLGLGLQNDLILNLAGWAFIINFVLWWLICMIWSAIAVTRYNKKIMKKSMHNIAYQRVDAMPTTPSYLQNQNKQLSYQNTTPLPSGNLSDETPNIQMWLKANPGKGINDYYVKFGK